MGRPNFIQIGTQPDKRASTAGRLSFYDPAPSPGAAMRNMTRARRKNLARAWKRLLEETGPARQSKGTLDVEFSARLLRGEWLFSPSDAAASNVARGSTPGGTVAHSDAVERDEVLA